MRLQRFWLWSRHFLGPHGRHLVLAFIGQEALVLRPARRGEEEARGWSSAGTPARERGLDLRVEGGRHADARPPSLGLVEERGTSRRDAGVEGDNHLRPVVWVGGTVGGRCLGARSRLLEDNNRNIVLLGQGVERWMLDDRRDVDVLRALVILILWLQAEVTAEDAHAVRPHDRIDARRSGEHVLRCDHRAAAQVLKIVRQAVLALDGDLMRQWVRLIPTADDQVATGRAGLRNDAPAWRLGRRGRAGRRRRTGEWCAVSAIVAIGAEGT